MPITQIQQIERTGDGQFPACSWPGSYPLVYLTKRGEVLCAKCATEEFDSGNDTNDDPVIGADAHWEGPPEQCANCNTEIESAYGDPESPES